MFSVLSQIFFRNTKLSFWGNLCSFFINVMTLKFFGYFFCNIFEYSNYSKSRTTSDWIPSLVSQVGGRQSELPELVWLRKKNWSFLNLWPTQVYRYWHSADNHVSINAVFLSILKLCSKKHAYKSGAMVLPINPFLSMSSIALIINCTCGSLRQIDCTLSPRKRLAYHTPQHTWFRQITASKPDISITS